MNIKSAREWLNKKPVFFLVEITIVAILSVAYIVIFSVKSGGLSLFDKLIIMSCLAALANMSLSMTASALLKRDQFGIFGLVIGYFLTSIFLVDIPIYVLTGITVSEEIMFSVGLILTGILIAVHYWAWKKWSTKI